MPGTTPAKLAMGGDASFNCLIPTLATITNGTGSGSSGLLDLSGGTRAFNVAAGTELVVTVPVSNGGLSKTGAGTMRLHAASSYASGTAISAGKLLVNNTTGSGTGLGGVTVNGGSLGGTGIISGLVTVNSGGTLAPGPGTSMGALSLGSAPILNGTNFVKIDRNGGVSVGDKLVLSSGTLNFGGTLVVSNAGATLIGGEAFTNFVAPARSGAFTATVLPALNAGLNWYLGDLIPFGRIKVNRSPVAGLLTYTNNPGVPLQIPIASLLGTATDLDGDAIELSEVTLTSTNGVALSTNGSFIVYSNNFDPNDLIQYTISDGHGGIANGAVIIAPSTTAQFTGQPDVTGMSATLHLLGGPAGTYYLERSTNFPDWVTISTNVLPSNGVLDYVDDFHDLAEPPASAFYRLRW